MGISAYHAKYLAHDSTRRLPPGSTEKLAGMVASAHADLLLTPPRNAAGECVSGDETRPEQIAAERQAAIQRGISERDARSFEVEAVKLDGSADDLKVALECELKALDRQIKEALMLEDKLAAQMQAKPLEGQRDQKRRSLFEA